MNSYAILTDVTKCIGCEDCVAACKLTHQTGDEDAPWAWQDKATDLSSTRWTTIQRTEEGRYVTNSLPALSGPRLRRGLPGRCTEGHRRRGGGLRSDHLHGLPLLHDRLPVPDDPLRVGIAHATHPQVHSVLQQGPFG